MANWKVDADYLLVSYIGDIEDPKRRERQRQCKLFVSQTALRLVADGWELEEATEEAQRRARIKFRDVL